jgi:hypothetical protein
MGDHACGAGGAGRHYPSLHPLSEPQAITAMTRSRHNLLPLLLLTAVACTPATLGTPNPVPCSASESRWIRDVLYLGRSIPGGGTVTDADWDRFVAEVLSPAFPEGFTVVHGVGQWRSADGSVGSEPSLIVTVLHPDTPEAEAKVLGVGARYRERFRQEAVLHERHGACVTFIAD